MSSPLRSKIVYLLVGIFVFAAAFFKIADLDFWWHLRTGQVILEQKSLQHKEIYSFTAQGNEYIDHEWLFQVIQYVTYAAGGETGIILLKTATYILLYCVIAAFLIRKELHPLLIVTLLMLSICGARSRFIERPEMFSILFLVCSYVWIDSFLASGRLRYLIFVPLFMMIWSNLHAAVILGLVLQLAFLAGLMFESVLRSGGYPTFYGGDRRRILSLVILFAASLLASGVNPYGFRTLLVPFQLTNLIDSGLLDNQEWRQPLPLQQPFFYICLILTFLVTCFHFRKLHVTNLLLASFLGYVSLKYVRNVGLFCVMMPLLISPYLKSLQRDWFGEKRIWAALLSAGLFVVLIRSSPFEFGIGIASYFPDRMVQFIKDRNLKGNMLNSYAFGGYFAWTLYPDRKIFVDGRNEVYLPLLREIVAARGDSRSWNSLLAKYQIEYALLNYVDELEEITVMSDRGQPSITYAPFTSSHFPRRKWALIYWDDDGMVLIQRDGVNRDLLSLEYKFVYPEGEGYQQMLVQGKKVDRVEVIGELQRKLAEDPKSKRAQYLLQSMRSVE